MKINNHIDSNALALEIRNFGILPPHLTKDWMINLASVEDSKLPHPTKAIIEIINSCNLDCPMCRVGQFGINFNRVLSLDDFKKAISQIEGLTTVRLNGLGESTLIPNFEEYLEFLFENKLRVELISNGSGKIESYKKILANGGSVIISWDSAEPEIFEKLRRPAKWNEYVSNLKLITKGLSKNELQNISLLFTIQKININQLSKLVKTSFDWKIENIIVNAVKDNSSEWGSERLNEIQNEFILANKFASQLGINLFLPSQIFGKKISVENSYITKHEGCKMPWKEVVIRWNGDVQVCNMFNPFVYGNIHLNSFNEIWNNLFANLFRKMIDTEKKHPYCINCVYFEEAYKN
jgi:radical SAM protein with 4Fe4S-binding SPASM domain